VTCALSIEIRAALYARAAAVDGRACFSEALVAPRTKNLEKSPIRGIPVTGAGDKLRSDPEVMTNGRAE